jgi:hypothetical protein
MQQQEILKLKGELRVVLNKEDGTVEQFDHTNLVVDSGLNFIVERMASANDSVMSHMAIGTDNTAAAAANTTLGIEAGRVALASTSVSNNTITYAATFGSGTGTGAITEAGILNASSSGTLLCRTVFPVVNKQSGDSMTITWTVTVS